MRLPCPDTRRPSGSIHFARPRNPTHQALRLATLIANEDVSEVSRFYGVDTHFPIQNRRQFNPPLRGDQLGIAHHPKSLFPAIIHNDIAWSVWVLRSHRF